MGNTISLFRNKFSGLAVITQTLKRYRPFPSSKKSHFQNEAKCETFVVKISTLYNGLYREGSTWKGFFRRQVCERVGVSQVEVYERVKPDTVISVCKKAKKG